MSKLTITPPDQRVNLGSRPDDGTVTATITVTLTAAEAEIIAGSVDDRQDAVNRFITDWVSPSLSALGEWLGRQAMRNDCRICRGKLIGSELGHGTCGKCGGRAVTS